MIEPVKVTLPRLDSRLSGLRFAVVSDIHLGPLTGRAHTERIVRMINGLRADVVAIVGDLVDGTVAELGPLARPLRGLRVPLRRLFRHRQPRVLHGQRPRGVDRGARRARGPVAAQRAGGDPAPGRRARPRRGQRPQRRRLGRRRPTSTGRWAAATEPGPRSCSRTSRSRPRRPRGTAWTCSCPGTRTVGRWCRSTW